MEGGGGDKEATPLHTSRLSRRTPLNRAFALIYSVAILVLLYRHSISLLRHSTGAGFSAFSISFSLFLSDIILAFLWLTTQSFRMRPLFRRAFPENLTRQAERKGTPALDIFICTADPHKEPPMGVVNTALSVLGYEYPTEKLSVYVSDDGGSELTLFAFMEAAKFGIHWLPFCRENHILERSPEAFFSSNYSSTPRTHKLKTMYESMKLKVEKAVERGKVSEEEVYITNQHQRQVFNKYWDNEFTRQQHPTIIQVLLESGRDKDMAGESMPNLIYLSREKSKAFPHHFKAGALNTLLRVSAIMTNAPVILTLDCDMFSNDPRTPQRALCYLEDSSIRSKLGYIQFPQRFHGLNKGDIYACEFKRLFQINPVGMDGLEGPSYVGTGCFFSRRTFFGPPSSFVAPEIPELNPNRVVEKSIQTPQSLLELAHHVAACNYEDQTDWGSRIGFRYGSLVEDYYTGYRLQCEGWKSVFCDPKERPAFLGDVPISLNDVLNQTKRWSVGLFEVAFSKYCPVTFGAKAMGLLPGLSYAHYAFWPILSIPITTYAFLPQLALLHKLSIFPKVSSPWFLLYAFLFIGSYVQDCVDFVLADGSVERWWSDQRMWLARGVSCYLFGSTEYLIKLLGVPTHGFNVTSKVVDDQQSKRYDQGYFEFGVASPMFVPLGTASLLNLVSLIGALAQQVCSGGRNLEELFVQIFVAGFGVANSWPVYDAMLFRRDKGKMPLRTTFTCTFLAWLLYSMASFLLISSY